MAAPSESAAQLGSVEIPIVLESTTPIGAIELRVTFDPEVLRLDRVSAGSPPFDSAFSAPTVGFGASEVRFATFQDERLHGPTGAQQIATLSFLVVGSVGSQGTVSAAAARLVGTDGADIAVTVVPAVVKVGRVQEIPALSVMLVTLLALLMAAILARYRRRVRSLLARPAVLATILGGGIVIAAMAAFATHGDVDDDGEVTRADALALLAWLTGQGEAPPRMDWADVTADGIVDVADALRIAQQAQGLAALAPRINAVLPTSGSPGELIHIQGDGFATAPGGSSVSFAGAMATAVSATATDLEVTVPTGATSGPLTVIVDTVTSNAVAFEVPGSTATPVLLALAPREVAPGALLVLSGAFWGATPAETDVLFSGATVAPDEASPSSVLVEVPSGIQEGNVSVRVGGRVSNALPIRLRQEVVQPVLDDISPATGAPGTQVTLFGHDLGATPAANRVSFAGVRANVLSATSSEVDIEVPMGAVSGPVAVEVAGAESNSLSFTVSGTPALTAESAVILGEVRSTVTELPMSGVTVSVAGFSTSAVTDYAGIFRFPVPGGESYRLTIMQGGFTPSYREIYAGAQSETAVATIYLTPIADAVTVSGSVGGTVTDSAGDVQAVFPPAWATSDASVRLTPIREIDHMPGPLSDAYPGFVMSLALDTGGVVARQPAEVRIRNTAGLAAGTRFPFTVWDTSAMAWRFTGDAVVGADGRLYVSTTTGGKLYAIDRNADGTAGVVTLVASGFADTGFVVAGTDGRIYVQADGAIYRLEPGLLDGREIWLAGLTNLGALAADPSGGLVISDIATDEIVRVGEDGMKRQRAHPPDGISDPVALAVLPDGSQIAAMRMGLGLYLFRLSPSLEYESARFFEKLVKNGDGSFTEARRDGSRLDFDGAGRLSARTDPNGNQTSYGYDASERLESITDPVGQVTSLAYDGSGKLARIADPSGRVTRFVVDGAGDLVAVVLPGGSTTTLAYDQDHRLVARTDTRGFVTKYFYDPVTGRARQVLRADGEVRSYRPTVAVGLADSLTDGVGTGGNPAIAATLVEATSTITDGAGGVWSYAINRAGQETGRAEPDGAQTAWERDERGNAKARVRADGSRITYHRDRSGQMIKQVDETITATTSYTYDETGNLTEIRDPLSRRTTLGYDTRRNATSITLPGSATYAFGRDARGQVTSLTDPLGNV
ncbi:MAG: IPT/TIG domain-containing protein [Candidatus Schekmanbacteria bacterium]|nr:IPT/TIG domain-containing protein [Candidatus Schekmanbacteria bacterium]